ncbi:MAG: S8 family serine peptidase [Candidatus Thorarchaeota archaeon]|nr:S8 family serine peptidase [Candidatus Thorarchaeota archaeon]
MPSKAILSIILVFLMLSVGPVPSSNMNTSNQMEFPESVVEPELSILNLDEPVSRVSISFERELTNSEILEFENMGISFGLNPQHIGSVYIVEVSESALNTLALHPLYRNAEPLKNQNYHSPRDVSIAETYTNLAWSMKDYELQNLTGKDILIADLDTGIQWRHPDFFYADGESYNWYSPGNLQFDNGTDGIDLNNDFAISSNEILYVTDTNRNSVYETDIDWIWLDNGTILGAIDDGDTFFVVADTNSNNVLNIGENLIALKTPKTKYIVEKNGLNIEVWERGVNLTSSTHYDTHGHGTGVAGILNGGQLGYRQFVGIAPDAELMMIDIFDSDGLTVEEGLIWARDHGADVIIIEVGSWTYEYLDGSSNVELMIDSLTRSGIPVIVPAGNLFGGYRHAQRTGLSNIIFTTRFEVPSGLGISELYITILCNQPVNQAQIIIQEPVPTGFISHILNPGTGYNNWVSSPATLNVTVQSFTAKSMRGTSMIAINIKGTIKDTTPWHVDIINPNSAGYHFYIADDATSWSGGAIWTISDGWWNNQFTITWPSTADTAISVASYMSRNLWSPGYGFIAPYSSCGPRIDNIPKMSVSAPGGWDVVSSWSSDSAWASWMTGVGGLPLNPMFGGYQLFSGTSAAGPHVAGAVALMLQLNKDCGSLAKYIIEASAYTDAYTGAISPFPAIGNNAWGYGKLNVSRAILETKKIPIIHEINQNPVSPQYIDAVTVTANISNADYISFQWTDDDWQSLTLVNMTLSGGIYSTTVAAHSYGTQIDYVIISTNNSAIASLNLGFSYLVDDRISPIISLVEHNATAAVYEGSYVIVTATASEPPNASGLASVIIEFSLDNWASVNTMFTTYLSGVHTGFIPPAPVDMTVKYRVKATDFAGNIAVSAEGSYTVQAPASEATDIIAFLIDNLPIVIGSVIVLLLIVYILMRRRR